METIAKHSEAERSEEASGGFAYWLAGSGLMLLLISAEVAKRF
jgi:hypothetical protein